MLGAQEREPPFDTVSTYVAGSFAFSIWCGTVRSCWNKIPFQGVALVSDGGAGRTRWRALAVAWPLPVRRQP